MVQSNPAKQPLPQHPGLPTTATKPTIINLSKIQLTTQQIKILSKGLKFTPTPEHPNTNEIHNDISHFCRKLRLTEEFFDKENPDESIVRNKSSYRPSRGRNKALDHFCDYVTTFPYETLPKPKPKSNTSRKEWIITHQLHNNKNITIKEADKGSTVVIMDTTNYINSVSSLLQDTTHYESVQNYQQSKIMTKLTTFIRQHQNSLTTKEFDYLTHFDCRTSFLYGLPKIHKNKTINDACKESTSSCINLHHPSDLKLRPIVAGPNCETHRLSNFIDILLKPLLQHIPSYIRDDLDLLNHLPQHVNCDTIIASFDVVNLYTTIPHQYGLEAMGYWLEKYPNDIPERIDKSFITEGLKFILQNNYFEFNRHIYKQISGTAMGTKVAPTYANLVMAYLEVQIYEQSRLKYGLDFHRYMLKNWKRYLDDCLILWSHTLTQLLEFKNIINGINSHIQFTMEYSQEKLPFLDILIKIKNGNRIETDIHYKPTDSQQYLLFTSNHPKHTKTNIPFNLARRICTIVSNHQTRDTRLQELKTMLLKRQYPLLLIENGIRRAESINIQTLRKPKQTQDTPNILPYISTHNPKNTEAYTIIHNNIPLLRLDPRLNKALETHKITKSKRQPKSLKKLLTSAKLPSTNTTPMVKKCGRPNCGTCPHLIEGSTYNFHSGHTFVVKNDFSCASKNLIYVIRCTGCHKDYVGQSSLTLRQRMTVHRQQLRDPTTRQIPLSGHLDLCALNKSPKFLVFPLYLCSANTTDQTRIHKENLFIHKYKPQLNTL